METSLRLRGGGSRPQSKSQEGLRIHAKEKLPIASNALLQVLYYIPPTHSLFILFTID
jgi:hypothetical protein